MTSQNVNSPIGIFDSGLGGLSILSEIQSRLKEENIYYLADSANAPYGEKSKEKIIQLSISNTEFLLSKGCKMIVVACNTATTNAISVLRSKFNVPFIGIEPAIKPAALNSKTQQIGVLATRGTLSSQLFHDSAKKFNAIKMIEVEGQGIVEAIEGNKVQTKEFQEQLYLQMKPLLEADIDHLVLGCSHYPFIIKDLKQIFPPELKIIDSGFAVARQTEKILYSFNLQNCSHSGKNGLISIFTNRTSSDALNAVIKVLGLRNYKIN